MIVPTLQDIVEKGTGVQVLSYCPAFGEPFDQTSLGKQSGRRIDLLIFEIAAAFSLVEQDYDLYFSPRRL